jgi:hypothetical protein
MCGIAKMNGEFAVVCVLFISTSYQVAQINLHRANVRCVRGCYKNVTHRARGSPVDNFTGGLPGLVESVGVFCRHDAHEVNQRHEALCL